MVDSSPPQKGTFLGLSVDSTNHFSAVSPGALLAMQDTIKRVLWSETVHNYLRQMDYNQLFSTSLRSRMAAKNVSRFMVKTVDEHFADQIPELEERVAKHRTNPNCERTHDGFVSVLQRLMQFTGRELGSEDVYLRASLLQYMTSHLLSKFGLHYGDVKLMQAATNTFISGSFVAALIHRSFSPNDLDLFCGRDKTRCIVRYFEHLDLTVLSADLHEYSSLPGIRQVTRVNSPGGGVINIIEAHSDSAINLILNFHSAPTRGLLSWDKFSHFEVHRARNGFALITPTSLALDLDSLESQIEVWHILHKYMRRGFTFIFEYNVPHECGKHIDCAATPRTTVDEGCLHIALPSVDIPNPSATVTWISTWSLGPVGMCTTGTVNGLNVVHSHNFQHMMFRKLATALIQMYSVPTGFVRVYPWTDQWRMDGESEAD
ncbi:hypothetical protein R3P38DRAFT_3198558 [Favolaschia claudopus]|uniref:Uncharacterized protein n=1 Tax=Favolaschia claudopus TaxID=2862362 RepID=A0AAW0B2T8_9AGAR